MGGKAAIILVVGFSFILGYISLNLNRVATQAVGNMSTYANMTASNHLAKTGANIGLSKFYQDTTWYGTFTQSYDTPTLTGSVTVSMTDLGPDQARIRSVSSLPVDGSTTLHDTIEVFFDKRRKNSFSLYAWMTNFEGNVFWITGDTVWGRVHSNGNLHVNGKPVFMEKVTTAKGFDPKVGKGTNNAIFKKGYETGVAGIDFPDDLKELIDASTSGGRRYPDSIWVTLSAGTAANDDGMAYIRPTKLGPVIDSINLGDPSFNGALVADGKVNVEGVVDGVLTIGSLTEVHVQNDILYAQNPRFGASDDLLGLVAEQNVVVADNAENNTDCEIHASVFARTGSFMAENYDKRPVSGELRLLGSLVQDERGAVGTFTGSTLKTGFFKRYRYDVRLADPEVRPPFYPGFYVKTFAISNWWESYRIADFR